MQGIPEAPTSIHVNQTSSTTIVVSWKAGYDGGERVNFTVQCRHNGSLTWDESFIVAGRLNIVTLSRDEGWYKFRFRVIAVNMYGPSNPSEEVLLIGRQMFFSHLKNLQCVLFVCFYCVSPRVAEPHLKRLILDILWYNY